MPLRCEQIARTVVLMAWLVTTLVLSAMPAQSMRVAGSTSPNQQRPLRSKAVHLLGVSLNLSKLQLTEDQERKIKDARKFARLKLHELKQAKIEKTAQLKTMLFNPTSTEIQLRACGEEIRRLQSSIDNINLDSLIQLREILTPEQRSRLAEVTSTTVALSYKKSDINPNRLNQVQ